ncbi:BRCT domain-containing protein [Cavenderia fasciculata]|uniref:DNA ligase n=1 Tax=Cavenderia fasciculata TaxID=261658 RepID=F4PQP4_CACFS|nr:BRCT domain-containing protein [Cavenderia fasciculata]EGG21211.1 BRCT domain-containing protein [Cavenderia fasciculata]|eukprot:XP_004359061.1 BRCT domain-containing protein [Cavenderia fasciculata]
MYTLSDYRILYTISKTHGDDLDSFIICYLYYIAIMSTNTTPPDKSGSLKSMTGLCSVLEKESAHSGKMEVIQAFCEEFKGDLYLLAKLFLVKEDKRVFRIKDKQMVKILAEIWDADLDDMTADLDKGDVTETAKKFMIKSGKFADQSTYTLKQVDEFLDKLTTVSKFDDQVVVIKKFLKHCTPNDWRLVNRMIDSDLKVNTGAKFFLEALHPQAFEAYKKANNLKAVIETVQKHGFTEDKDGKKSTKLKSLNISLSLMTPIKPMLPKAVKSVDEIIKQCSSMFYAEIKYDGERIQIHKDGKNFKFYSRNLKPIMPWKVVDVQEFIPKATKADSIILDGEILLMDTKTSKPLPFGTLGVHKKQGFSDATVCVFLFDILYLNGESLINLPMHKRREILEKNVNVVKHRIELSETTMVKGKEDKSTLSKLLGRAIKEKLEGLVIKDSTSVYEPGCRHWIKIKKDYLHGMADSADLLAIGGYYGTGSSGGLVTVFLMCVYDKDANNYKTVCKVSGGLDDKAIEKLQPKVKKDMIKISKDSSKLPAWLDIIKSYTPDFIVSDPKKAMVFELEAAEITGTKHHTSGYSMRFPRITKIRHDKDHDTATTFKEFKHLAADVKMMTYDSDDERDSDNKFVPHHHKNNNSSNNNNNKSKSTKKKLKDSDDEEEDEDEDEMDTTTTTSTTSTSTNNTPHLSMFTVLGSLTEPIETDSLHDTIFILNLTDNSGKWRKSGISGVIGKKWKVVESEFEKESLKMGQFNLTKVEKIGDKKIFVCNIACIKAPSKKDGSYDFKMDSFTEGLQQVVGAAKLKKASIHTIKPNLSSLDWDQVEPVFVKNVCDKGIKLYIHSISQKPIKPSNKKDKKNGNSHDDNNDDGSIHPSEADLVAKVGKATPILYNCNAVITGFTEQEEKKLADMVKTLGGTVSKVWVPFGAKKTTHLICNKPNEVYTHVDRLGGVIVERKWLDECFSDGCLISEEHYIYHDQNNPDYDHEDTKPKKVGHLLDIFANHHICLLRDVNDRETLERYIIAFGGSVADICGDKTTQIVTSSKSKTPTLKTLAKEYLNLPILNSLWIWDSINQKVLLSSNDYLVK